MTSVEASKTAPERSPECGSERSPEHDVLLCRLGVITVESLISSVSKCVIKLTLDDTL